MANADGGWLIIGYQEQTPGSLTPDPNHSEGVCDTYEPTNLSKQVNSSLSRGQQVRLTVHFEFNPDTDLRYPIIAVEGFDRTPYVCRSTQSASDTGEGILKQGAVYLRRPGAETSEVSTPADWEQLVSLVVRKRREEFLVELRDLLERMTSPAPTPTASVQDLEIFTAEMHRRGLRHHGLAGR